MYLSCNSENNFIPELPKQEVDVIYLCYPNNPTRNSTYETAITKVGRLC